MKNLMLSLVILISMASSCKKEQTTLNELVGDWKIDKIELLQGIKGDSIIANSEMILKIGDCAVSDNSSAGCETSELSVNGKKIKTQTQYSKSNNTLNVNANQGGADIDEATFKKAGIMQSSVYKIKEQTSNRIVLEDATVLDLNAYRTYLGFKYKIAVVTLSK
jgi:hypothetical protein